jgi:arylsulfatase A-like enzyme
MLRTAVAGACAPLGAAARRPNVLIILADDMGYADASFQGCKDIPTPHLDRLARGGVRFASGCVSHPFCSPTRAGLMTGRYQQRFGHENNPKYDPADEVSGLPVSETTVAQVMRDAGYRTGHVGKWHLGAAPKFHPLRRGFQESFGFIGGGHDYFRAGDPSKEYTIPIQRDGQAVEEPEYLTDAFSREAEAFIRRHKADPFFLYLAYNTPHTPQQAPDKYLDRFANIEDKKRRYYNAMVSALDDGAGRVLGALNELKLDRDTLVFFLSDNGGPIDVNGSHNTPLRGAKGQVYEGGIRVPFVMRWTGHLPAGKVYHEPAISLDIFPTAAAVAGARTPANLDGVNLLPHLEGKVKTPPHQRLFWRTGGGTAWAVREERYKLVKVGAAEPELYDLDDDIGETTDLAASRQEVTKRLLAAHEDWNRQMIPPRFESPNPAGKQGKKKSGE